MCKGAYFAMTTIHEIHAQYDSLKNAQKAIDAQMAEISALASGASRFVFIGCGSSYTLAKSGALMAQLRLEKPAIALPAGDMLLHLETYRPLLEGAMLIALTRSGETSEVVRMVEGLRERGVSFALVTVTCVSGSTLSRMSDLVVEFPWAFDESVCQTRTVTTLYFFCAYTVAKLCGDAALAADLVKAAEQGDAYMARIEPVLREAAALPWNHAVVLGDAELSGLCGEGALAFKEICQLPSNSYHLLDVRHGPMVLIGKETLVIVVLSDSANKLELDLLRDLLEKGATVIAYSDLPLEMPGVISVSFGEALRHPARGIPAIAVCQLISYHKSFATGANPDRPDGLSPWIALS